MIDLYPLRFKEILRNYGFGDRWIVSAFEKEGLPDDHRIAETWEVCDRPSEVCDRPSEVCDRPAESSEVRNGPLAGKTLHELIADYEALLLGRDVVARGGLRFPLLIKFLDASNVLGEQAHHSDELAAQRGLDDPGKTEAWYMLRTRPGATIHCGPRPGVSRADVRAALEADTTRELMKVYDVDPGDAFLLYAGTMHYSEGGVLFYELMQNSDVYISLRAPQEGLPEAERQAQIAASLEGVYLEEGFEAQTTPVTVTQGVNRRTFVLACRYFALERLDLVAPYTLDCDGERFYVLSQITGSATVSGGEQRVTLRAGHSCLLPASLGPVTVEPGPDCALLNAYVPDLARNIVAPLRAAGVPDAAIAALGGHTARNDLVPLL